MSEIPLYVVDAFTAQAFGGNRVERASCGAFPREKIYHGH